MGSVQVTCVSTIMFSLLLLLLLLQRLGNVQAVQCVEGNTSNSTCAVCIPEGETSPRPLYIAFFTSFGGAYVSSGAIPAVELALELINNSSTILPGYSLNYTEIYAIQCERTSSYRNFFRMIDDAPPYPVAALGMGCAVAAEPVAQINSFWNFPMMGYVAAAPTLSDRDRLPSYYRTYPSDEIFVPGIISLISYYGWKELCLITEEANTFMLNDRTLRRELPRLGVNISDDSFQFDSDEHPASGDRIRRLVEERIHDPHIFFINTFEEQARALLCEFYQLGIRYPQYLFITHGWYQAQWWSEGVANLTIPCTDEEMQKALEKNIALQQFPKPLNASAPTDTGLSGEQFDELYRKKLNESNQDLRYQLEASDAFDATWALALAMDNASESLCNDDLGHCANTNESLHVALNCYKFFNDRIECLVNRSLNHLKFEGVSGTVMFDGNGTRIQNIVEVFQYRQDNTSELQLQRQVFAIVNRSMNNTFSYVDNENNSTIWRMGLITPDGVPIMMTNGVHIVLVVLFELLGVAGIVFTIICFVFNIVFRERKVVKLTSPNLNYFIIAGALLLYLSVILRSLPGFEEIINILRCYVGKLFSSLGYTVAFGAVLVKMWRVYIIFHNPGAKRRTIQDWKLLLIVGGLVSVMVVLLVLNYSILLFRPEPTLVNDKERSTIINNQNVTELFSVYSCGKEEFSARIFQAAVLGYIILLQVIGIILAFQTRKVKVKVLNDSKWVAAIIYSSSLCVVVIILSEFALVGLLNTSIALLNLAEITATTIFLALVFIPKMVSLYKDPLGENVFSTSMPTQQGNSSVGGDRKLSIFPVGGIDENSKMVIATLQAKVNDLEHELKKFHPQNDSHSSSNRNTMTSMDELSVRFEGNTYQQS